MISPVDFDSLTYEDWFPVRRRIGPHHGLPDLLSLLVPLPKLWHLSDAQTRALRIVAKRLVCPDARQLFEAERILLALLTCDMPRDARRCIDQGARHLESMRYELWRAAS